jgi:DNA polymerase-3 subunit gamma/tau
LVSKDAKVAVLLEVPEGFKQRYLETASRINDAWLLSALNILNESEINYRLAKNKRLHVELTFIKLCYLHQAIELAEDNGQLSKKKTA